MRTDGGVSGGRDAAARTESTTGSGRVSRAALEWLALAALLGAVIAWTAWSLAALRREVDVTERRRLEHQAHIVERMLGTRLEATVNALDALRADAPVLVAEPRGAEALGDRMRVMVSSMAGVRTFLLVGREGRCIASNRPELLGQDFRGGERYQAIVARPERAMLYVSPPFLTPLGNWALSLGRVILDAQGRFDGYLLAIIDPEYFHLLLDSTRYAPDMTVAMIHSGGKLIFRVPDAPGAAGLDISQAPASAFSRHLASGLRISSWMAPRTTTGEDALIVLQTILPSSGPASAFLVASFSRETAALFAPWRGELRNRAALVLVLALGGSFGLYFRQRRRAVLAHFQAEREAERRRQEEERAVLQARLGQSQKLESIGRLAGGVAHDFNNLLTVILSSGDEAREGARRGDRPDPSCLDEIMGAAQRAADLTRQLLAFARKQVIDPVTLDLNEHLRRSESLVRRVIGEDVRVAERLQAGAWPVRCDPGLLDQVLLNLAANARDAMPGGGTLTLATENVSLAPGEPVPDPAMASGDYVRLAVEDTGAGMPREVLEHLFEPFFTTKAPGRGTGLGLSSVYGIVKQSGAHLCVRSAAGKGTTFEIYFPRQRGEAVAPAAAAAPASGGTETILVVEDDAAVRGAVVQALRAGGYRVLTASSAGEEAALSAGAAGVHLLLTDVVMPGQSGPEVARQVQERCPGVRVLYMSGYTREAIDHRGVLDEGIDLVSKPFTPAVLRARVREVLDRPPRV